MKLCSRITACWAPLRQPDRPAGASSARRSPVVNGLLAVAACAVLYRVVRYALGLDMDMDEVFLLNNVLAKSYQGLLAPLSNAQAAAPGVTWLFKFILAHWSSDFGVRLAPLCASLVAVLLFAHLCRCCLRGLARYLALGVFCVAWTPIVYATRAKPYAFDLLVSVLVLTLTLLALRQAARHWPLWLLVALTPLLIWSSYTAAFLFAGTGLVLGAQAVYQRRSTPVARWVVLVVLALVSGGSWVLLYAYNLHHARSSASDLVGFWAKAMPPWDSVPGALWWLIDVHTGRGYGWPVGDNHLRSSLSFALWLAGLVAWWRYGARWPLALLLAPQALLLLAAVLHQYPYGGDVRISIFLGPGICLLMGAGGGWLARRLPRDWRRRAGRLAVVALALVALAPLAKDSYTRWQQATQPTIPNLVRATAAQLGPGGLIVVMRPSRVVSGSGGGNQLLEYYLRVGCPVAVHWGGALTAADLTPGRRVAELVTHPFYRESDDPVDRPGALAQRFPGQLRRTHAQAADGDMLWAEVRIYEVIAPAPAGP